MSREMLLFTDMDGTLLDHHSYSFAPAKEAIAALILMDIPWILNSSKTLAELSELRAQLGQAHPVIVENGAGIAIPCGYKHSCWRMPDDGLHEQDGFLLKKTGRSRDDILHLLQPLKAQYRYTGFADMSQAKLSELTGLPAAGVAKAMQRYFSEPILWQDSQQAYDAFVCQVEACGLSLLRGGRFIHIMGGADKGRAMQWLLAGYRHAGAVPVTVALGDSHNDLAMLKLADIAVVVRSPVHAPPQLPDHPHLIVTEETGPAGWNRVVLQIIHDTRSGSSPVEGSSRGESNE
ncbi:MAG: HAD family hydrolase [Zetaproteobacteria bacterium CG12_big_fil_rev_8_21_14_0_65_54_13]|nr:MAG: HAD family hydrolase [Zetaproteobacteria bacterium CG23_combo_of_CG06-09_8_20_14_all_54_7]PIW50956.1 MAG: HAD family hydrolase [Zetaproteobacteria bacterium CG12_big_fil_rev_8_21_14_0_65_54_13]PIX54815.1 MAG: HAD family hydrolase [Zetaproteobacteria bacterium CG_4_10_14_3_um_filter_54_28]PJA29510.1 MAG: HAD family hydrolase [Zetaproteobacteria bacterium CG_4_9_14_3_um_filter_54_145]